jgi:hypothetical protein
VAREIYKINFPDCGRLPEELDINYNRKPLPENSPFIVNSPFNPVKYYECENVDWNDENATLNKKCKRRVHNYCEEHSYLDSRCKCWRNEYRDLPKCQQIRRKYNDPNDYGCSAGDFSIEDHPDISNFIRKNRIPCWGVL